MQNDGGVYIIWISVYLPKTESLPADGFERGGKTAVILSSIGIRLYYDALSLADDTRYEPGLVDYVALEYADGTRYVVWDDAGSINNWRRRQVKNAECLRSE